MSTDSKNVYGYCPECYRPVNARQNGSDTCLNGHVYPSSDSLPPKGQIAAPPAPLTRKTHVETILPSAKIISPSGAPVLTPDQEKAISLILSGKSFVMIAFHPTKESFDGKFIPCDPVDATGCDFFTCMHGEKDILMSAKEELPSVLDRLYTKRGM